MTYPAHRQPRPLRRRRPVGAALAARPRRRPRHGRRARAGAPDRPPAARRRACPPSPAWTRARWRATCARPARQRGVITAPGEIDVEAAVAARAGRAALGGPGLRRPGLGGRALRGRATEGPLVAVVDFGLKTNIVRSLRRRGARVRVLPHTATAAEVLAPDVAGVVLSPGPGDPARLDGPDRAGAGGHRRRPAAAGHLPRPPDRGPRRGRRDAPPALRPSRRQPPGAGPRARGRVQVTAQNHEVEVDRRDSLPARVGFYVSQRNLNDGSVEGLRHRDAAHRDRPVPPRGLARARSTRSRSSTASWRACGPPDERPARSRRPRERRRRPALGAHHRLRARWSSARRPSSTTPARRPAARCARRASGPSCSTPTRPRS